MQFDLTDTPLSEVDSTDAVFVVGLLASDSDSPPALADGAALLDAHHGNALERYRSGLTDASGNASLPLLLLADPTPRTVIPVAFEPRTLQQVPGQRKLCDRVAAAIARSGCKRAVIALDDFAGADAPTVHRGLREWVAAIEAATYRYDPYWTDHEHHAPRSALESVVFQSRDTGTLQAEMDAAEALVRGIELARNIGNAPPNDCYPETLAGIARGLAERHASIKTTVYDEHALAELGANAILAVGRGSERPPRLIQMEYRGDDQAPIVLVGKGITFDTGGISLKPGAEMDEMKYDLGGAAAVLGAMEAIARMQLPISVVGVVTSAENMPDGRATRPGDIVRTLSGRSVEILNTDAEGRLVVCDALTFVERFEPAAVIDCATLTGACIIALGHQASAMYGNDDDLLAELQDAVETSGDRAWKMPLWEEYGEQLKSNFADLANIGGRPAGSITAAWFLSRFAQAYPWVHLDIAGVAWKSGKEKGATGRPVPLLMEFLRNRAQRDA